MGQSESQKVGHDDYLRLRLSQREKSERSRQDPRILRELAPPLKQPTYVFLVGRVAVEPAAILYMMSLHHFTLINENCSINAHMNVLRREIEVQRTFGRQTGEYIESNFNYDFTWVSRIRDQGFIGNKKKNLVLK